MDSIPLDAFEGAGEAILVSDPDGRVVMINQAASLLLGCDKDEARDRPCWEVSGLLYRNGAPFCGPDCPIRQRLAGGNQRIGRSWLIRRRRRGRALGVELFTFAIPGNGTPGVLHVLAPTPASASRARKNGDATADTAPRPTERKVPEAADPDAAENGPDMAAAVRRLQSLSGREREILELLAQGRPTRLIAEALGISANTVRNHVRGILEKLRVHRRLEAVLVWLMRTRKQASG
jgi:PAS domain S-box-containing protein